MGTDLLTWAREFILHKDIFQKKIKEIKETVGGLDIIYKDHVEHCFLNPVLEDAIKNAQENVKVFTLNSKKNFDVLLQNWASLCQVQGLTIYFINDESNTEQKWVVRPDLHDRIADDDSLKTGLQAMFATVDVV